MTQSSPQSGPRSGRSRAGVDQQTTMRAWSASMDMAIGLLGFGFFGWLLDRWLGTSPWIMLGLGLVGLGGGSYRFIREAVAINRETSRRFSQTRSGGRNNPDPIHPESVQDDQKAGVDDSPEH